MIYKTSTTKQTFNLGKKLAKKLKGGEILLLQGDLGSGKTVLVKGLAVGLGIKRVVTSPTFVLFKVYPIAKKQKNKKTKKQIDCLVHVDAYRLADGRDLLAIGLDEYWGRPDTVVAVEWGAKLHPHLRGERYLVLRLKVKKENQREIEVTKALKH